MTREELSRRPANTCGERQQFLTYMRLATGHFMIYSAVRASLPR